jgi:hypothetical protein
MRIVSRLRWSHRERAGARAATSKEAMTSFRPEDNVARIAGLSGRRNNVVPESLFGMTHRSEVWA